MKTTSRSILRLAAIAFLVVTPLAMAMIGVPRLRTSVLRITGLQKSESPTPVARSLPSGTQSAQPKTDAENPAPGETAKPVEPSPVVAEKKTDEDRAPQKTGVGLLGTVDAEPLTLTESGEATPRTARVAGSFAGQEREQERERERRKEPRAQFEKPDPTVKRKPREERLIKAQEFKGDLRSLPYSKPKIRPERPERELEPNPSFYVPPGAKLPKTIEVPQAPVAPPVPNPPAPPPIGVFEGLDRFNWGSGSPPDTVGDVGPNHYIQAVNSSVGIYDKSGNLQTAFTFDTLMSQGSFGNQCDTENFGDPVVLYDTFEDRWILTDFAFTLDGGGNVNPPIAFQCFAVSQNGDPVSGGWYFYSRTVTDGLNDYPKFGIWSDGVYMSANVFQYAAGGSFITARAWAFNKAQMYAGSPTVKVVSFDIGGGDFTVIPSNARLQTGTPPPGRPNMFISSWLFLNALTVYKFQVDWTNISLSTLTGPDTPLAATSWPNAAVANVPQSGTANLLDALQIRAMMQNQYTNFTGTESLWLPHTVRRANTTGFAAPRWYQVNVTGGTVNPAIPQAATWDPDGANVLHRWMPSLALDRAGNMLMGYSVSSSTTFPSMRYAGRLAADPVNTFSQTEQIMFTGTASQTTSTRWGDYSAMTLDPNGCTFWYTNEYANPASQVANMRWLTKFASIGALPGCTPFGAGGTISGTVTVNPGGAPISGATVMLGSRSTTTNGSGNYSFLNIPAGTYPSMDASKPGFGSASASSIVVTDAATTTQDFALTDALDSACLTDTTQADFLTGVGTNVDLNTTPGNVTLTTPTPVDQQNTAGTTTGTGVISNASWAGQTFTAGVNGQLVKVDFPMFCSSAPAGTPCTLNPNLSVSIRATSGGLPTGADLASASIAGNISGSTATFSATFASPLTITAGTQYALIVNTGSTGAATTGYFWIRSSPSTYATGQRVTSANSGGTWSPDSTRDYNFHTYVQTGYSPAGNLVSSVKDANPAAGMTPIWSTLSWNGVTPANTSLQFQVAGSNNVNGPFNFVGPDGTAGTFFTTSPANLQPQFYNFRYLEYKAYLATTDSTQTPTLNDVTLCFNDVDCSSTVATITPTPAEVCDSSTGNTASGPAGMTSYSWSITNGTITSATNIQSITYTAGASGNVTLNLTITAPNGCIASGMQNVPINPIPATPTASNGGPYCEGATIQLNTPTVAGATYAWTGPNGFTSSLQNPTRTNATTADAGTYSVTITVNGCTSAAGTTNVVVNATPATPTASNGGPYCEGQTIQLNTPTVAGATYAWTGPNGFTSSLQNPTRTNATTADAGTYSVTVTVNGCTSAAGITNVVVNPIPGTPTATNAGPYCEGATIQLNTPTVAGATYAWTGPNGFTSSLQNPTRTNATIADAGTYSVTVTVNGCTSAAGTTNVVINECFSVQDAAGAEPSSGTTPMLFTVTLSGPAPVGGASVQYATANGGATPATGGGACGGSVDYVTVAPTTVNFLVGEQFKTVSVTVCSDAANDPNETFLVNLSNPVNAGIVDGQATGTITANQPGTVLISELRTSGPGGAGDDFVEVYNNSDSPLTVAATDASAGYGLYKMGATCADAPVLIGVIPNGTVIPARGHYLFVGSAYSLTASAAGNLTMSSDIENDRNVALFSTSNFAAISSANRLDAVGFGANTGSNCDLMREGTNLPPVSGSVTEHSYFRKQCDWQPGLGCTVSGTPKDSNDNQADFWWADTQGTFISGLPQRLGAPGPENIASPIRRDPSIQVLMFDNTKVGSATPNRARDFTSSPANNSTFGTMSIRRRIFNGTGGNVTRLRFRIVDLSTFPAGPGVADLRAITSSDSSVGGILDTGTCAAESGSPAPPCIVTLRGTTLEQPPTQPNGGGYNSTLSAGTITLGTPLANGASINLDFLLGVQQTGAFRFFIIVEALP